MGTGGARSIRLVIIGRNDNRLDLYNGARAVVTDINTEQAR
jgi:hypothetical protein